VTITTQGHYHLHNMTIIMNITLIIAIRNIFDSFLYLETTRNLS